MELWDLYDTHGRPTGKTILRGERIPTGYHHQVVHICIFNKAGQMLIQHRQPFKQGWPNMWDVTVGGSAISGDTIPTAAEREVLEEIGYTLDLTGIPAALTLTYPDCFDHFFLVEREIDLDTLRLQYEEVQAVKWATVDEILAMIDAGTFIPYSRNFIAFLFQHRKNLIC